MMSYQHPTIYDDDTAVPLGTTTHDKKERVVPSGMMMESPSSSSPPLWKTKKAGVVLLGLLGLTAMVASGGAALVFPSLVTSSEPARTEEAFLLQASVGDDNTCVAATGPWPTGAVSQIEDSQIADNASNGPYVTCFRFYGSDGSDKQCWSHSYYNYNDGIWDPCWPYPKATFGRGWQTDSPMTDRIIDVPYGPPIRVFTLQPMATCGTACTGFDPDVTLLNLITRPH